MAEVLLFHHALGQTAAFHAFADRLPYAGHTVPLAKVRWEFAPARFQRRVSPD